MLKLTQGMASTRSVRAWGVTAQGNNPLYKREGASIRSATEQAIMPKIISKADT
jgi:hypothetical protein